MRRGVSRWVMPNTTDTKSEKSRTAAKWEGRMLLFPPRTQIVRIHGGDHVEQAGHHDEARAPVRGGHLHGIRAQAQSSADEVEQSVAEVACQAEEFQYLVGIGVDLALHSDAQGEHAQDRYGKQRAASPFAQQEMAGSGNQPAGNQSQIDEALLRWLSRAGILVLLSGHPF